MSDSIAPAMPLDPAKAPAAEQVRPAQWERHPADLARLLAALVGLALVLGLTWTEPETATGVSRELVQLIRWLPRPITLVATGLAQLAAILAPVVVALVLVARKSVRLIVVLSASCAVAALTAAALQGWLDETAPGVAVIGQDRESWLTGAAFPSPAYLAGLAALTTVLTPGLRQSWRRAAWWALAGASVLRLVTAVAVPLHIGTTVLLGIAVGSATLLVTGAPGRLRWLGDTRAAAAAGGHPLQWIDQSRRRPWRRASLDDGSPVVVRVVDRDERDAAMLFRFLTAVQRRGLGGDQPRWSPERLVQHEALSLFLAAHAGVAVPEVVGLGTIPDGVAVLLVRDPESVPLDAADPDDLDDDLLADIWLQVQALHGAGIAHRQLHLGNLQVTPGAGPGAAVVVTDLSQAELGAGDTLLAADVAELLVSLALHVGTERATASAAVLGSERLAAALPLLQPLALSSATRRRLRADRSAGRKLLDDLRQQVQQATKVERYQLAELQRLSVGRIVGLFGGALLVYVLLSFASSWPDIADALGEADLTRVPVVLVMAALTFLTGAISLQGAVTAKLPLLQTTEVMLGQSFLNRFTPANAGGMALRARYLQRNGLDLSLAATSIGLTSAASGVAQVALIAVFFFWSGSGGGLGFDMPDVNLLALGVVTVSAAGGLIWFTPPLRRRIARNRLFVEARRSLGEVRALATDPGKLALLFGGAVLGKLVTIVAFTQSTRAFGIDLGFAELGALYMTANTVASAAPTPGGLGAIEAALVAVLTGAGVDSASALSTVLVFRLATYWMPVPPAWLALRHLRSTDAV